MIDENKENSIEEAVTLLEFQASDIQDPAGIEQLTHIITGLLDDPPVLLVPAMGTTQQRLFRAAQKAVGQDLIMASTLAEELRTYHTQLARQVTSANLWKETSSELSTLFEELTDFFHGIYLLGELSSYGELMLASYGQRAGVIVLAQSLKRKGIRTEPLVERETITASRAKSEEETLARKLLQTQIRKLIQDKTVPLLPLCLQSLLPSLVRRTAQM